MKSRMIDGRSFFEEESEGRLSNRYIYCCNSDTFIMTGDLPVIRLAKRRNLLGSMFFCAETATGSLPLYEASEILVQWRAGHHRWIIRDSRLAGEIEIDVGNPEDTHGFVLRIVSTRVAVTMHYGGIHSLIPEGVGSSSLWSIDPAFEGNYSSVPFDRSLGGRERFFAVKDGIDIVDDTLMTLDGRLAAPGVSIRVCLRADFSLHTESSIVIGLAQADSMLSLTLLPEGEEPQVTTDAWKSMLARADALAARLKIHTPEPLLDMACAYTAEYQNGVWYPPRTMHAPLSWNVPFLGWTNRYGTDVLGWHERMLEEVRYYASFVNLDDNYTDIVPDTTYRLGTMPTLSSRFYGRGHVDADQLFYNMQTQFFDQAIHSWRMTGDAEMEGILYPILKLHCEWYDACFDRGGIYESVIDTWPTDSVWCGGGASSDATCYAYRAHRAVEDMARNQGDVEVERKHRDIANHIRKQFFALLWIPEKGHPGKLREWTGLKRLHENPWIYAAFLPVDTDLLNPIQAAQAVHYARSSLEYVPSNLGDGELISGSNWVPSIWSVRWLGGNEQYMMALAFFKAGSFEDGMHLLLGGVNGQNMSYLGSDGARAVLEGLFGFRADYPNGEVLIAPGIPFDWPDASLHTADISLAYSRTPERTDLRFQITRTARIKIRLPLYAEAIEYVDGADSWTVEQGFGRAMVCLELSASDQGFVILHTRRVLRPMKPIVLEADPGVSKSFSMSGNVLRLMDPQKVTVSSNINGSIVMFTPAQISGKHMLFAIVQHGDYTAIQSVYLTLSPTNAEKVRVTRMRPVIPNDAVFEMLDLHEFLQNDVETIYCQQYLSPRPRTVSACIGTDGYSPWTFTYWNNTPPAIRLLSRGIVRTKDGIPLTVAEGNKNIAFVSCWDNFPDSLCLPIGRRAQIAVVHLCGTTNPMQCGIENVRLDFLYEDGEEERVGLRNPDEFWSLCPLNAQPSAVMQETHNDYSYEIDAFCLPQIPPETLQLGENCRSVIVRWSLRSEHALKSIRLTALSQEIVIGVMSVTLVRVNQSSV